MVDVLIIPILHFPARHGNTELKSQSVLSEIPDLKRAAPLEILRAVAETGETSPPP